MSRRALWAWDVLVDFWVRFSGGGGSNMALFGLQNALLGFRDSGALQGVRAIES